MVFPQNDTVPYDYGAGDPNGSRMLRPSDIADEIAAFRQPPVMQGIPVNWYVDIHNRGRPLLAFVQLVRPGVCVDLFVPGAAYPMQEGVRHVDDPRHKLGHEHVESGAWDFTDAWKLEQEWKSRIEDAVVKLCQASAPAEKAVAQAPAAKTEKPAAPAAAK